MQRSNTFFKLCLLRTIDNMDFTDAENKHTDSISWPATRNKNNNLFCVKMGILTWYKHLAAPLSSDDGAVTPYKVTWMNASSGRSKTGTSNSSLRKDWKSTRINSERQIETYTSCDVDRLLKGWLRCNLSFSCCSWCSSWFAGTKCYGARSYKPILQAQSDLPEYTASWFQLEMMKHSGKRYVAKYFYCMPMGCLPGEVLGIKLELNLHLHSSNLVKVFSQTKHVSISG